MPLAPPSRARYAPQVNQGVLRALWRHLRVTLRSDAICAPDNFSLRSIARREIHDVGRGRISAAICRARSVARMAKNGGLVALGVTFSGWRVRSRIRVCGIRAGLGVFVGDATPTYGGCEIATFYTVARFRARDVAPGLAGSRADSADEPIKRRISAGAVARSGQSDTLQTLM